jgi:hypothetical protein
MRLNLEVRLITCYVNHVHLIFNFTTLRTTCVNPEINFITPRTILTHL